MRNDARGRDARGRKWSECPLTTRGLRVLTNRSQADRDFADEVEHYLAEAKAAYVARGLSPDAALRAARSLSSMLFGVSLLDPLTYLAVVALLAVVSAVACLIPAWRAAHIEPAATLRSD